MLRRCVVIGLRAVVIADHDILGSVLVLVYVVLVVHVVFVVRDYTCRYQQESLGEILISGTY